MLGTRCSTLKRLGIRFSLDDFDTGYSSLAYLAYLPLDQLKIDQSFIRELPESAANGAIVESTIALAQSLELTVIAEGVETDAQRQWLASRRSLIPTALDRGAGRVANRRSCS